MSSRLVICVLLGLSLPMHSQLDQDFDSGGLELWTGQVEDFVINSENSLQLMASEAGTSEIETPVSFPDSLEWNIAVKLDFAPSTSNTLDMWLASDGLVDNAEPTGYRLSIGETGSVDALRFFWVENGVELLIATGDMGQVAEAFELDLKLSKDAVDNWRLSARLVGEAIYSEVFMVNYIDAALPSLSHFGLSCKYTSTRTDKYYFDNILITELLPDQIGPQLLSASVISETKIVIQYDEAVTELSATDLSNYSLGSNITPSAAAFDSARPTEVCLLLADNLPSGSTSLTISGVEDENGNPMEATVIDLAFALAPELGDLVINEILYDPFSGNDADFVELINISDKYLILDSVYFSRANSNAKDVKIEDGLVMIPGQIVAFTQDKEEIETTFLPVPEANIIELKITNYVNDEGNVSIKSLSGGEMITLDSLDYSDDFHSRLLTESNKEGISLERIAPLGPTNDSDNWFSAASVANYGTPGYENSQRSPDTAGDAQIELENKIFSPDGDGYQDLMKLNYKLDKTGYIGNIAIYDDRGRLELYLAENKLLGAEGSVIWEGLLEDGNLAPMGMYIIYYDIFHADGEVIAGKEVCVLANRLN